MVTTVVSKVGVSKTGGPGVLEYTTLASWELNRRGNIVTRDTIEVAEVYGGGSVGVLSLSAGNWTVDADHYIHIRAAAGESHGGTLNVNKAYLSSNTNTLGCEVAYTKVGPGLSIDSFGGNCAITSGVTGSGPITIDGCILRATNALGYGTLYLAGASGSTITVKNCIIMSKFQGVVRVSGNVSVYNCTFFGTGKGLSGVITSQNNYISGGYTGSVSKGANDITTDKSAITASLRNIPCADSTTQVWAEAGSDAYPIPILGLGLVVFDTGSGSKMWGIAGFNGGGIQKVYSSSDGITWTEAGTNAFPVTTYWHTSVVYASKMWSIGGVGGGRKVYSSTNGTTWTEAGTNALPVANYQHSSVVYDAGSGSKMWVIGGAASGGGRKVYSSSDGITWTESGTDALPISLSGHTSVVFDAGSGSKMWVIGGSGSRKVYSSSNGTTWTEAGTNALPNAFSYHTSVVYAGKMWVIGGNVGSEVSSVYYSTDGITWTYAGSNSLPTSSEILASVVYNSKIWSIGGRCGTATYRTVYSYPNTPASVPFQSVTAGSENLRPVVSMANKLLDTGANLTSSGVTTDIIGTARPQNGTFDIGAFENDIPVCWNYTAKFKGSKKLFKASGGGAFPKNLKVPGNIDKSTGRMVDDGIEIDPDNYSVV